MADKHPKGGGRMSSIKCALCRFAQIDPDAPGNGIIEVCNRRTRARRKVRWDGVECTNRNSEYYKALLNINPEGKQMLKVTWTGCPLGERRDDE